MSMTIHDWEKQMLELSFADRLADFDISSDTVLEIVEPYFDVLAQKVAKGNAFTFSKVIFNKIDDFTIFNKDVYTYKKRHQDLMVLMDGNREACSGKLDNILRQSRFYSNYYARNILHISFGILTFRRKGAPAMISMPVFSLPCKVKGVNEKNFVIEKSSDLMINPILNLVLRSDFGIALPPKGVFMTPRDYIDNVLLPKVGRKVGPHFVDYKAYLSLYSTNDLKLMNKINSFRNEVKQRFVLQSVLGIKGESKIKDEDLSGFLVDSSSRDIKKTYSESVSIDDFKFEDADIFNFNTIMPSDESQIRAVGLAHKGVNFLITAPPGCNKINTVMNIIADNVISGKRVLYISCNQNDIERVQEVINNLECSDNVLNYCQSSEDSVSKITAILDSRKLNPSPYDYAGERDRTDGELSGIIEAVNEYRENLQKVNSRFGVSYSYAVNRLMQMSYVPDYTFTVTEEALHVESLRKTMKNIDRFMELQFLSLSSQELMAECGEIRDSLDKVGILPDLYSLMGDADVDNKDISRFYEKYVVGVWCQNLKDSRMFDAYTKYDGIERMFKYKPLIDRRNEISRSMFKHALYDYSRKSALSAKSSSLYRKAKNDTDFIYSGAAMKLFSVVIARPDDVLDMDNSHKFDIVIIDSAQNQFPLYLVPFAYHANQLICIGDNALPEFSWKFRDPDGNVHLESMSVYSVIIGVFPSVFLSWHYQSQDEGLIEFSNRKFYQYRMLTLPSPRNKKAEGIGLVREKVNGRYDLKAGVNRAEADRVAEAVSAELDRYPMRSIGVVAFTDAQANLIRERISDIRKGKNENYAVRYSCDRNDFYIESAEMLSDVDVRDTVFISTQLAPGDSGMLEDFDFWNSPAMVKTFNRAITLSRLKMVVVTSVDSSALDVSYPVYSHNVIADFFRYLENQENFFGAEEESSDLVKDSCAEFEIELHNRGYLAKPNFGVGRYRVPIAVYFDRQRPFLAMDFVEPNLMTFLTCYECLYARQYVFEELGWKYLPVWFVHYYFDRENALRILFGKLKDMESSYEDNFEEDTDWYKYDQKNAYGFPTYHRATFKMLDALFFKFRLELILDVQAPIYEDDIFEQCSLMLLSCHDYTDSRKILSYSLGKIIEQGVKYRVSDGAVYSTAKDIQFRVADTRSIKVREFSNIVPEELMAGMRVIKEHMGKDASFEKVLAEMKRLMRTKNNPNSLLFKKLKKMYRSL